MTAQTMTIYDPAGVPFEMEWFPIAGYCEFCDADIIGCWAHFYDGGQFVVCDGCAKANAASPARAFGVSGAGVVAHDAASFPFD